MDRFLYILTIILTVVMFLWTMNVIIEKVVELFL